MIHHPGMLVVWEPRHTDDWSFIFQFENDGASDWLGKPNLGEVSPNHAYMVLAMGRTHRNKMLIIGHGKVGWVWIGGFVEVK